MYQGNIALKFVIEVVGLIGNAATQEDCRSVQNYVVRLSALVDRGGVDERLKGRTYLALRLSSPVEFRLLKITPADHGFDISGSIVERQQRPLRSRILIKKHSCSLVWIQGNDLYISEVSGNENLLGRFVLSPRNLGPIERGCVAAEFDLGALGSDV